MKCSDISVEQYVRNRYGYIGKYTKNSNGIYEIKIRNGLVCRINSKEEIVKHSKDIKDLLQIGDIITTNNLCGEITKIDEDTIYLANYMGTCNIEDIKSVITAEQIKQIEFRIKE